MVKIVRRRYIAFKLKLPKFLPRKELLLILKEKEASALGDKRSEISYIRIIQYDPFRGIGIFRCGHKTVSAFRNTKKIFGEQDIEVIRVSGSIKSLRRKLS